MVQGKKPFLYIYSIYIYINVRHINVSVCLSTPGAAEACLCPILKHLDWAEIKRCGSWINWTALVPDGDYKLSQTTPAQ